MDSANTDDLREPSRTFTLGAWTVDGESNQLITAQQQLTIEPKMMDVLIYLCQHAGETVSAEQLLIACWAGTFYGDSPVQKCIAGLRKKLGCNAKNPTYIETIYRRGYKIIAPVTFPATPGHASQRQPLEKWTAGSPYLGLNSFSEQQSAVYFGRTKATADVICQLKLLTGQPCHFLLLLGKSGSGKSSLMRAGVLPHLNRASGFSQLRVSHYHFVSPSQSIDEHPVATLVFALQKLSLLNTTQDTAAIISRIQADPAQLQQVLAADENTPADEQVQEFKLLVIDQFEQFLLDENAGLDAKQHLVRCLSLLAHCNSLLLVAVLRNDFYAECLDVTGFNELKRQGKQYDLQAPTPVEITRMIRNPAIAAGLRFEHDKQNEVHLDEVLLEAAVKNPDALPLLEYTLDLLYKQRSADNMLLLSAYRKMGGIEGAIAQQAEKVFNQLPASVQACWDDIMHALIQVDHKNKYSVTARKLPMTFFTNPAEKQFIQHFLNARLFVTIIQTNTGEQRNYSEHNEAKSTQDFQFITIAHEALLKHWQRIKTWLNNNNAAIHKREQLADDCQFWLNNNKVSDALLNSKQKVLDAEELMHRRAVTLTEDEQTFIELSKRYRHRKRMVFRLAVSALIGFSVLTVFLANRIAEERDIALSQGKQTKAVSDFLTDTLAATSPFVAKGKDVSILDILQAAEQKLDNSAAQEYPPLVQALLHKTLGLIYIDSGKIVPAERHIHKGLALYKDNNFPEDENYLGLLFNLSRLNVLKHGSDNLAVIKETIAVSNQVYGEDHQDTLGALDNLGTYYLDNNQFNRAEDIFRQVLERRTALFGADYRHTLYSLENLGDLYFKQHDYEQAAHYYQRCLDQWAEKSGLNNPYTLYCLKGVALTQMALKDFAKAEQSLIKHIEAGTQVFGKEHPQVLGASHHLAELYQLTGRAEQAESLFRQTLKARTNVLGASHQDTLDTQKRLSVLLSNQD
ncbi:MAG: tetratricopeptide repeat protein [Gammaproteobacteria bacterium]|nr:tetratricopeptide repeat protein [Gammaproteobacteria bacterium]